MSQAVYNFPPHISGDTFEGISFILKVNGVPKSVAGASIEFFVYPFKGTAFSFSTANSKVLITNGPAGEFKIVAGIVACTDGSAKYRCSITFADGTRKTYFAGSWLILSPNG